MSKIAYIDHSFHKNTVSTEFIPEILRRHGHIVDYFWDESWQGGPFVKWSNVENYDIVIMFQSICPITTDYYRKLHPNVIFIPMLDQFGMWQGPMFNLNDFFRPFHGSKVLNFSNHLHGLVTGLGINSKVVKYYPAVDKQTSIPKEGLHGFFWVRRNHEISWPTIKTLISESSFDSFHVHLAHDPGTSKPTMPTEIDKKQYHISTSTWFDNKKEFITTLERANVYFSPRMEEGIGQAFLEALSRGQCVVAPNNGTMNEYIIHGQNGMLYNPHNPLPLNFDHSLKIGKLGMESAITGRSTWESNESDLVKYILTPSNFFYKNKYQHNFSNDIEKTSLRTKLERASQHNILSRKTKNIMRPAYKALKKYL